MAPWMSVSPVPVEVRRQEHDKVYRRDNGAVTTSESLAYIPNISILNIIHSSTTNNYFNPQSSRPWPTLSAQATPSLRRQSSLHSSLSSPSRASSDSSNVEPGSASRSSSAVPVSPSPNASFDPLQTDLTTSQWRPPATSPAPSATRTRHPPP